ncbi:MAG TPA: hypothetical protein VFE58_18870 [Tepidisphaeraceae bacterium]|nr:hypothetical protein [Tepidisphaeraceae bacterium]
MNLKPLGTATFWVLLMPSAFAFALPGAIFGNDADFNHWAPVIFPLQAFVTLGVPYVLTRRALASRRQQSRGFPVILNSADKGIRLSRK